MNQQRSLKNLIHAKSQKNIKQEEQKQVFFQELMLKINEILEPEEHQFFIHCLLQTKQKDVQTNHQKIGQRKFFIEKPQLTSEDSYLSLIRTDIFTHQGNKNRTNLKPDNLNRTYRQPPKSHLFNSSRKHYQTPRGYNQNSNIAKDQIIDRKYKNHCFIVFGQRRMAYKLFPSNSTNSQILQQNILKKSSIRKIYKNNFLDQLFEKNEGKYQPYSQNKQGTPIKPYQVGQTYQIFQQMKTQQKNKYHVINSIGFDKSIRRRTIGRMYEKKV